MSFTLSITTREEFSNFNRTTHTQDVFPIIQMYSLQAPITSAVESLEHQSVAMLSRALAYVMLFQLKYSETVRQAQTSH